MKARVVRLTAACPAVALVCVLAAACTTARTAGEGVAAAAPGPSVEVAADPTALCLSGREVLRVPAAECGRIQAGERAETTRAGRALDRVTLELSPRQLDLELLEGIVVGARYKYRVEPSYRDRYFTRVDAYSFPGGANVGDLLGGLPLGIGLSRGSELLFAQQFASGPLARSPASTYLPSRLPVDSEKALALKVGDYVRFETRLAMLANAGQVWPLAGFLLDAEAGFSVLLDGEYEVHVFRLDESRVRLKLVAERGREVGGGLTVSVAPLVTAALLDRASARLVPLSRLVELDERAALAASRSRSELFLVDYTLDLSRPAAAAAYERIFEPELRLTDIRLANPLQGRFQLRDRLLSSIEDLDRIARRDLGRETPAVERHFQASNRSAARTGRFRLELKSLDVTRERVFRENVITRRELAAGGTERLSYFLLPTWSHTRDRDMLFGMLDETQVRTADALFIADETGRPARFLNIGFGLDYDDARLRASEYRRLRRRLELLLPADAEQALAALMADTGWLADGPRRDLSISLRYFFREAAFDGLVAAGYGDRAALETAVADFIVRGIEQGEFPLYTGGLADFASRYASASGGDDAALHARAVAAASEVWRSEIARTAASLSTAFTAGGDNAERMRAVLALRNDAFYRRIGTALWVDLVQRAGLDLSNVMYLSLELRAEGHEGISFSYGEPGERELYESVRFIQAVLNDRSLDMREPGELDTIVSRMNVVVY